MPTFTRRRISMGAAALAGGLVLPSRAAGWPERDILFVNPWSAAGSVDAMIRQYTKQVEKLVPGANFTVQSMPGGSGTIGVGAVVRARPDGHTLGYAGSATIVYQPMVMKGLAWSRPDDLQLIGKLGSQPALLVVKYDSPLRTFDDFLREVTSRPLRVAVAALRTPSDLELQQMNLTARTQIRTVPFSGGTGETITALLGGRVDAITTYGESVRGHVESRAMRAIAVFKKDAFAAFPDVRPVGEVPALKDVVLMPSMSYVVAPKGLPRDVLDKLVAATKAVITSEEYQAYARRSGLEAEYLSPDEIRAELVRLAGVYETVLKKLDKPKA